MAEQHLQSILDEQGSCASLIADPALWKRHWLALASNGVLVTRDPMTSHAYAEAVFRIDPRLDMGLEASARELSAAELSHARELAAGFYRDCCS